MDRKQEGKAKLLDFKVHWLSLSCNTIEWPTAIISYSSAL